MYGRVGEEKMLGAEHMLLLDTVIPCRAFPNRVLIGLHVAYSRRYYSMPLPGGEENGNRIRPSAAFLVGWNKPRDQ